MKFFSPELDEPALRRGLEAAFARVLDSGWLILGPELEAFEAEFAGLCGTAHGVGVGNGLDALVLALRAGGIGPGDEVIVPAHTFVATWLAVRAVGATIVPVEVDPATRLLTAERIAAAVTPRTAAVVPVSLYGHPLDMAPIMALAQRHGLFVVEDAAQAHGAAMDGVPTGASAHATAFSFYPTKNLGALGDGGAVVTADPVLAERIRKLRNYGSVRKYAHETAGVNSRLDELQAAFLRVRLPGLTAANDRRRTIAARYDVALDGIEALAVPFAAPGARHVYHLYAVELAERDRVQAALAAAGIETLIHYPTPCHLQPAFADLGFGQGSLPGAERLAGTVLSLPLWPGMDPSDAERVADAIRASM